VAQRAIHSEHPGHGHERLPGFRHGSKHLCLDRPSLMHEDRPSLMHEDRPSLMHEDRPFGGFPGLTVHRLGQSCGVPLPRRCGLAQGSPASGISVGTPQAAQAWSSGTFVSRIHRVPPERVVFS
jgi:hypothetical protein